MQKISTTESQQQAYSHRESNFSLGTLLTILVIVVISAIILIAAFAPYKSPPRIPCMSNLRQISVAITQYELDNHQYPEYLFGPAQNGKTMQQVAEIYRSGKTPPPGLYPKYIESLDVFSCPDNTVSRSPSDGLTCKVAKRSSPNGRAGKALFYTYSSYEANPRIDPATPKYDTRVYMARYSRIWTEITAIPPANPAQRAAYTRQLIWRYPPDDTYVTMCTYHVPKGKVIVLFLNGQAKVLDVRELRNVTGREAQDFDMYSFTPPD